MRPRKEGNMSKGMVPVVPRGSWQEVKEVSGKTHFEKSIRSFLWDNPELRRAFREAQKKELAKR